MKNKTASVLLLFAIFSALPLINIKAQSKEGCFDQNGRYVPCGGSWQAVYQGVSYTCVCNCSGQDNCTPNSSSSSSNNYSSGSGDYTTEIASAVIGGLFNALDRWLNSLSPSAKSTASSAPREMTQAEKAEMERKRAEYRQHVLEQVNKASSEYSAQMSEKFEDQRQQTLNDFKTKMVRSESVKTIKQLNCAAYYSIQAAKENCRIDFTNMEGSMEQARSTSDFASGLPENCPEIKISILDVTPSQPVGFQQVYYETIRFKADSISNHVTLLKETGKEIQKKIEENEATVKKIKSENNTNTGDDDLLKEAMKALEESKEEQKNITEDIRTSEKRIELYETLRSNYDINKNDKPTSQNDNK